MGIHSGRTCSRCDEKSVEQLQGQYPEMDKVLELSQQVDLQIEAASGEECAPFCRSTNSTQNVPLAEDFDFESQREAVSTVD